MTDLKTLRRDSEMSGGIELPKVPHTSGASGLSTNENEPTRAFDVACTGQTAQHVASTMDEKYQTLTVEIERLKSKYRIGIIGAIGILLIGRLGIFLISIFEAKEIE